MEIVEERGYHTGCLQEEQPNNLIINAVNLSHRFKKITFFPPSSTGYISGQEIVFFLPIGEAGKEIHFKVSNP